ncbi:hypothetical protein NQ317_017365 [Molorchus minor]|uniref:Uncharacterized protein n=1 Tax=Molorchus minor TaxID=1323400 RepID=A0ABQ9J755_9CUCU|nr:hypothetical protein NQ317_017365 [Molorchus minor]
MKTFLLVKNSLLVSVLIQGYLIYSMFSVNITFATLNKLPQIDVIFRFDFLNRVFDRTCHLVTKSRGVVTSVLLKRTNKMQKLRLSDSQLDLDRE